MNTNGPSPDFSQKATKETELPDSLKAGQQALPIAFPPILPPVHVRCRVIDLKDVNRAEADFFRNGNFRALGQWKKLMAAIVFGSAEEMGRN